MGYILLWLLFGLATAMVAKNRGASAWVWFVFGVLLGPFALVMAFFNKLPACPFCKKGIDKTAVKCPYCQSSIPKKCPHCGVMLDRLVARTNCTSCARALHITPEVRKADGWVMLKTFLLILIIGTGLFVGPAECKGSKAKSSSSRSQSDSSVTHVDGYTKKNGTRVAPHDRTSPNDTSRDNWSTKGNVNPETGKKGTKKPRN